MWKLCEFYVWLCLWSSCCMFTGSSRVVRPEAHWDVYVNLALLVTEPIQCGLYEFRCKNGRCIDNLKTCDDWDDCGDGSDEADCGKCSALTDCQISQTHRVNIEWEWWTFAAKDRDSKVARIVTIIPELLLSHLQNRREFYVAVLQISNSNKATYSDHSCHIP